MLSNEEILHIYYEIKTRCHVSNEKIAQFLNMHLSRLRRMIKKNEVDTISGIKYKQNQFKLNL